MVEFLSWQDWDRNGRKNAQPGPISPFMIYYYARRYDDIPAGDHLRGSTARGGMKAWFSRTANQSVHH
jgi:hypothetical protein